MLCLIVLCSPVGELAEPSETGGLRVKSWYCAYTHPSQEAIANAELQARGFETFLPVLTIESLDGTLKSGPLFPRYLFVRLDLEERWQPARYARGVSKLLGDMANSTPTPIRTGIIDLIKDQCNFQSEIKVSPTRVGPGDRARVVQGAFTGFDGLCLASGPKRVQILLSLFGRPTEVRVDAKDVEKVVA